MSRILVTWERGSGYGHLAPLLPIALRLRELGHELLFAVRDTTDAGTLLKLSGFRYVACPTGEMDAHAVATTRRYAEILHNIGFGDVRILTSLVVAWRRLFDAFAPDFVLCDHSPTALVSLRGRPIKRGIIGMGFCCPPPSAFERPLMDTEGDVAEARSLEDHVLANVNGAVDREAPPLVRLSALFGDVDAAFLMTYAELDHFPDRPGAEYRGAVMPKMGESVDWPPTRFPKVLVYSREFPALAGLLDFINRSQLSAVVVAAVCPPALRDQFGASNVHFLLKPFDIESAAAVCDLAITNGNHGTTSAILLAGKPVLVVPTVTEQYLLGQRVEALGAGQLARGDDLDAVICGLMRLLRDKCYQTAALQFRERYAAIGSESIVADVVATIERCARDAD